MQDRRSFLKSLGLATLALVTAPSLLVSKKPKITWQSWEEEGIVIVNARALAKMELESIPVTLEVGPARIYTVDGKLLADSSQLSVCQYHLKEPFFTLPYHGQVYDSNAPRKVYRVGRAEEKSTFIPERLRLFLTS